MLLLRICLRWCTRWSGRSLFRKKSRSTTGRRPKRKNNRWRKTKKNMKKWQAMKSKNYNDEQNVKWLYNSTYRERTTRLKNRYQAINTSTRQNPSRVMPLDWNTWHLSRQFGDTITNDSQSTCPKYIINLSKCLTVFAICKVSKLPILLLNFFCQEPKNEEHSGR